jgi:hypothetical protein
VVGAARDSLATVARLTGWSLLYLLLAVWWWPDVVIAAVLFATAWSQARTAAAALADLVKATVDLHVGDLSDRLVPARQTVPLTEHPPAEELLGPRLPGARGALMRGHVQRSGV